MSESRQLVLLLVGALALGMVGLVGAIIFPEPCEELESLGTLELEFSDAAVALPVGAEVGAELETLGVDLGIGTWRGAVAVPTEVRVLSSQSGMFIVTDTDVVATRPLIGVTSAARDRTGLGLGAATDAFTLRDDAGTIGVFNSEYELERCGELADDVGQVLAIDRGFVLTQQDATDLTMLTLSGDTVWSTTFEDASPIRDGTIAGDDVLVLAGSEIVRLAIRTGETRAVAPQPAGDSSLLDARNGSLLDARDGRLLLLGLTTSELSLLELREGGLERQSTGFDIDVDVPKAGAHMGVLTPRGAVALVGGRLLTDRGGVAQVPSEVEVVDLVASGTGFVGLLVEVETGERAVLYFGPDSD